MSAIQDTLSRADAVLRRKIDLEEIELNRADAQREAAERDQARADSFKRAEVQERYDTAYRSFGEGTPEPVADESVGRYRMRLFETLRRRLPSNHEWATTRADEIPPSARNYIESQVIEAATAEGLKPSVENLPPGREVVRVRIDANTGARATEFFRKESFIRDHNRSGQRVLRFLDPTSRKVIWGAPMPRFD